MVYPSNVQPFVNARYHERTDTIGTISLHSEGSGAVIKLRKPVPKTPYTDTAHAIS
jgi:hypothetical protein